MMNQLLCILFQSTPGLIMGFSMDSMHRIKSNAPPKWVRVSIWVLGYLASASWKVLGEGIYDPSSFFHVLPFAAAALLSAVFCYEGTAGYKIAVLCVQTMMLITAEIPNALMMWGLNVRQLSLDYGQLDMALVSLVGAVTSSVAIFLAAVVWRKFKLNKRGELNRLWIVLPLPIVVLLPTALYTYEVFQLKRPIQPVHLLSMVGTLFFVALMICLQFNQAEKVEAKQELMDLRHERELERRYYENVEARREELSKLRHDYKNMLTSVVGLLDMGEEKEAERVILDLLERVEATGESCYCGLPIVNAILSDKAAVCERRGICLRADLLMLEDCRIAPLDLCSIFSNLLDNAIRACGALPQEERTIDLNARYQGDYLLIRCDNPVGEHPERVSGGTGYGTKILSDIARRYEGEFHTERTHRQFTAKLVLLAGADGT